MFSVIIPLFNKSSYVEKCLLSVLTQSFKEFEIIVVNDGSTDDSRKKAKDILDSNPPPSGGWKVIDQANSGVSTARNNGVKAAKYEHIAFLDADDWWEKDFLGEMYALISEFPDAGIYGNRYYYVKNGKTKLTNVGLPENFEKGYIDYCKTYSNTFAAPFNCSFVILKKQVFVENDGFNPKLKFGEDFDLWIKIALKQKIAYLNKALAYSNQDAPLNMRALGSKLWNPDHHYIFNLDYLQSEEKVNPTLKKLLDGLRVRALIRYRLSEEHKKSTQLLLQKVDFRLQTKYFRRIYSWPLFIVKLYFRYKKMGSTLKQKLINLKK